MVVALSYIFAVILTAVLACILYPVAGVFWLVGLLGKVSEKMFQFSNNAIKKLWADISNKRIVDVSSDNSESTAPNGTTENPSTDEPQDNTQPTENKVNLQK
ncbi:MAG: hypothetical protein ACI4WS_06725 [Oscillospiraceae bacterium]